MISITGIISDTFRHMSAFKTLARSRTISSVSFYNNSARRNYSTVQRNTKVLIPDDFKPNKGNNRIIRGVDGLFDAIQTDHKPIGFESLTDTEAIDPKYGKGIITRFKDYNDAYFYRNFDPDEKIFTFNHAFSGNLLPWVKDVTIPLVQGKGIPTQVYFTLRQMKLLNIAKGDIQIVRMSQIQNLDTAAFIHNITEGKIIYNFDSIDILAAPSNDYMKTVMIQAGYEIVNGKIIGEGRYFSVEELKNYDFPLNPKFRGSYEAFMKKYGLSGHDKLYLNYNIIAKVRYTK